MLRQHYLVGGESLINEWHAQFLAERRRSASEAARSEQPPRGSAVQLLSALRDRLKVRVGFLVLVCHAMLNTHGVLSCGGALGWLVQPWCEHCTHKGTARSPSCMLICACAYTRAFTSLPLPKAQYPR